MRAHAPYASPGRSFALPTFSLLRLTLRGLILVLGIAMTLTLAQTPAVAAPAASTAPLAAASVAPAAPVDSPCDDLKVLDSEGMANWKESVFQQFSVGQAICELEQLIIEEVIKDRGVESNAEERAEVLAFGRDEVRARLLIELTTIAQRDADGGTLTDLESAALEDFQTIIAKFELSVTQKSTAEYRKWGADACNYSPPEPYTYSVPGTDCTGATSLGSLFTGGPNPPTYKDFVKYGARKQHLDLNEDFASSVTGQSLLTVSLLAGGTFATVGAATAGAYTIAQSTALTALLFFCAKSTVWGLAVGAGFAIAIALVVAGIVRGIQVLKANKIGEQLNSDTAAAQARVATPSDVDVPAMIADADQTALVMSAFAAATAHNPDVSPSQRNSATPDPEPGSTWFKTDLVTDGRSIQPLPYFKFKDIVEEGTGSERLVEYKAWLSDRWWVVEPISESGSRMLLPALILGGNVLHYDGTGVTIVDIDEDTELDPTVKSGFLHGYDGGAEPLGFAQTRFIEEPDTDGDGTLDGSDNCPTPNSDQADADGDGRGDACDADDTDGPLGDLDGDGILNKDDWTNRDGPLADFDKDGARNDVDNCYSYVNADQSDIDGDGIGDPCDDDDTDGPLADSDADGVLNGVDNCVDDKNAKQRDRDSDGIGDVCDADNTDGPTGDVDGDSIVNEDDLDGTDGPLGDLDRDTVLNRDDNCREVKNSGQEDADGDNLGDMCDPDSNNGPLGDLDGDGKLNKDDRNSTDGPLGDVDDDTVLNRDDNCRNDANTDQADTDGDGIGDACDTVSTDGPAADSDGDGVANKDDTDNSDGPLGDLDDDGATNETDNCANVSNPKQLDSDENGTGDRCEKVHRRGISIVLSHRPLKGLLVIKGRLFVEDGITSCAQDRRVVLKRWSPKRKKFVHVAATPTRNSGKFNYRVNDRAGGYRVFAYAERHEASDGFTSQCGRATTRQRHHHQR